MAGGVGTGLGEEAGFGHPGCGTCGLHSGRAGDPQDRRHKVCPGDSESSGKSTRSLGTRPQGRSDRPLREAPPSNQMTRRRSRSPQSWAQPDPWAGQVSEAEAHEKRWDLNFTELLGTGRRKPSPCPPQLRQKHPHRWACRTLGGLCLPPEDAPQEMTVPTEMTQQCAISQFCRVRAFKASSMDVPLLDSQAVFRAHRIMFLKRHNCTRNCPVPTRAPKVLYLICFLFLFTFPFSSIPHNAVCSQHALHPTL